MWIKEIMLGFLGLCFGFCVAGGSFALIMALGVITRFAARTHTAGHVLWYENAAILGGTVGTIVSVYSLPVPVGMVGVVFYGLFAGIFSGAWAMALTEILDVIPIFSRRINLKKGMAALITVMGVGRTIGALLFYYQHW